MRGKAVEGKVSCTSSCLVTYVKMLLLWRPDACLVYWDIVSSLYTSCQPCQQLQDLRQEMYLNAEIFHHCLTYGVHTVTQSGHCV